MALNCSKIKFALSLGVLCSFLFPPKILASSSCNLIFSTVAFESTSLALERKGDESDRLKSVQVKQLLEIIRNYREYEMDSAVNGVFADQRGLYSLEKAGLIFDGELSKAYDVAVEVFGEAFVKGKDFDQLNWRRITKVNSDQLNQIRDFINQNSHVIYEGPGRKVRIDRSNKILREEGLKGIAKIVNSDIYTAYGIVTEIFSDSLIRNSFHWRKP